MIHGDFPGGPVIKNLPANTGETGLISGQETKIPHAMRHGENNTPSILSIIASKNAKWCKTWKEFGNI